MLHLIQIPESSVMFIMMMVSFFMMSIFAFAWGRLVFFRHKDYRQESSISFSNLVRTKIDIKRHKIERGNMSTKQRNDNLYLLHQIETKLNGIDFSNLRKPLVMESFFTKNEIEFIN